MSLSLPISFYTCLILQYLGVIISIMPCSLPVLFCLQYSSVCSFRSLPAPVSLIFEYSCYLFLSLYSTFVSSCMFLFVSLFHFFNASLPLSLSIIFPLVSVPLSTHPYVYLYISFCPCPSVYLLQNLCLILPLTLSFSLDLCLCLPQSLTPSVSFCLSLKS